MLWLVRLWWQRVALYTRIAQSVEQCPLTRDSAPVQLRLLGLIHTFLLLDPSEYGRIFLLSLKGGV